VKNIQRKVYTILTTLALAIVAAFGAWWFDPAHIPNDFHGAASIVNLLLFLLVSYVVWHPIAMNILSWAIASHMKDSPRKHPARGTKVAFITTFVPSSESIDLLRKTLPAMVAVKYPHDTWLLDEGDDPAAKKLCAEYGVKHFSRYGKASYNTDEGLFARKTKGGNHNAWYDAHGHEYDIVAQLDTDFIPKPSFLTKTLGYFRDPKVAFVGTPQIYGNTGTFIARGAAQQTYNFYGPILRGLYGMDTTLLIGANHIIRVKALQDVGHYSAHITEDLLTGMKLHANGWKSVYVHEPLAIGEGPTTWAAYFNQQMRWAYGCIDILFRHAPHLLKQMNWRQRFYYFFLQQHYFSGLAMALSSVGLALYFFFGIRMANMSLAPLLGFYTSVLVASGAVNLWLQRFYIRPKQERGFHFAGKIMSIASWPIFFLALIAAIRKKRLVYAVTPKGTEPTKAEVALEAPNLFLIHLLIGTLSAVELLSSLFTHRQAGIMIFWAASTATLLLSLPFTLELLAMVVRLQRKSTAIVRRVLELEQPAQQRLPLPPTDEEKYSYFGARRCWAFVWLLLSAMGILYGFTMVMIKSSATYPVLALLAIMVPPNVVNFWLRVRKPRTGKDDHVARVASWAKRKRRFPSIDVFLPSCGEDLDVLRNTFYHVSRLDWRGEVNAYVLDDADLPEVKALAEEFNFNYIVRANRGELKKAGNLINAFEHTSGDFIVVYDADFVPRPDFLYETIPYMDDPRIGVVQTSQYFDVNREIGWMERYAGVLQEVFFRWIQPARDTFEAAICAGTNVVYRRKAVDAAGGFARAPIGEDVHSGVKIWTANYRTRYVQLNLAKGLAPDTFNALANQQYRWCRSSMLLMVDKHFQRAPFSIKQRMAFWAAFLYYMSSAALLFTSPLPTDVMLWFYPKHVHPANYLPMLPAIGTTFIVFPTLVRGWLPTIYRQCMINSFCHLLAVSHALRGHLDAWVPTGAAKKKAGVPLKVKRIMLSWIITTQAIFWTGVVHDLPKYGLHLYWPTVVLGSVQLFMLAPLPFVGYDMKATLRRWVRPAFKQFAKTRLVMTERLVESQG